LRDTFSLNRITKFDNGYDAEEAQVMRPTRIVVLSVLLTFVGATSALAITVTGTNGPDTLRGTPGADTISGKGGNDRLYGLAGNDTLVGGPGRDVVSGGEGRDRIQVRDGARDVVTCGPGRDTVTADQRDKARPDCEVLLRKNTRSEEPSSEPVVEPEPEPKPEPEPPEPSVTPVDAGSYKGATSVGNYVFFDATPDRTISGFRVNNFSLVCDGPLTFSQGYDVGPSYRAPIGSDGSFSIQYHWDGGWAIDASHPATGDVNISGYVKGSSASGTARLSLEFDYEGRHWRCATEQQTWTANRLP